MAGIRLRPVQYTPDIRGLAAPERLPFYPRTERLAGLDSGPRHEPPALARGPGTWGGPLLQLSSTCARTHAVRARRPSASPEKNSAEVFLRLTGLPPFRAYLPLARVLPDTPRNGPPAKPHPGTR